ncbi:hypothetical protein [Usitatibacter palustris]|uniref:Uncharacterized protein n=1 Tax=Usitatibacter palustris TaxID=2732487 RepID=A0A6M4H8W1_9PROT|nr:hypothetical protein [Usitatibacter palustris]QJR15163.1 hypothetical protein DSM104440_01980 [Usitatibacter palustris]
MPFATQDAQVVPVAPQEPHASAGRVTSPSPAPPAPRDYRDFVEARREQLAAIDVAYEVSQALEECYAVSLAIPEAPAFKLVAMSQSWPALAASEALTIPCRGFEGHRIHPGEVLSLLRYAADGGEPRARARLLLMRDVAAPKESALEEIPWLLASKDAGIVRDVGAFLARGETDVRLGGEDVAAKVSVIAWELAACDLGYACGPESRITLAQCAFSEACSAGSYEQALEIVEPPETLARARALRDGIVRALGAGDWRWLGLR